MDADSLRGDGDDGSFAPDSDAAELDSISDPRRSGHANAGGREVGLPFVVTDLLVVFVVFQLRSMLKQVRCLPGAGDKLSPDGRQTTRQVG